MLLGSPSRESPAAVAEGSEAGGGGGGDVIKGAGVWAQLAEAPHAVVAVVRDAPAAAAAHASCGAGPTRGAHELRAGVAHLKNNCEGWPVRYVLSRACSARI